MSWDTFLRWVLFCAGIITSIFAGYMFYTDNVSWGAAWLAMAVGFLCFATRIKPERPDRENDSQDDKELNNMAMLIADIAVMSLQNIGRTVPAGTKEIEGIEDRVNRFLDSMPVNDEERQEIADKFDTLRQRTRRNESGRALMRSSRL